MSEKLWGGRFAESTDALVESLNASIDVDKRLYKSDIAGSIAHLKMMAKQGMITKDEVDALVAGLNSVETRIDEGKMAFSDSLEDIHMHVEDALGKVCGDTARKLHTGRSRNDQVALDIRIWLKAETMARKMMVRDSISICPADILLMSDPSSSMRFWAGGLCSSSYLFTTRFRIPCKV